MTRTFFLEDSPDVPAGFADLNDEQQRVVGSGPGAALVIAGAGSGKTRVLTHRVAYLLDRGVAPSRVLLLTFTNRAASEMLARVASIAGDRGRGVWGGTFHGTARRLLRQYAERLGYPATFSILDREDSESLMKQCIAESVNTTAGSRFPRAGLLVNVLSRSLNTGVPALEVFESDFPQFAEHRAAVETVFVAYQGRKFACGVVDFDDLLTLWRRLLDDEDVRGELTHRFEHVLVDEYQDTNRVQAELVDQMASGHGNLMVVGDDCQAIYAFRGADHRNILEFPSRHPGAALYRLESNYRSSPQILHLANASIAHNKARFDKELRAHCADGFLPGHVRCMTEEEQSMFVAQRVLQLRDEGVPLDRMAVLYRAHWQSMQLQLELGRRNLPFRVHSGQRFFEQRHIKDVLAFLRVARNPRDELAFSRVVSLGEGIGPRTASQLFAHVQSFENPVEGFRAPSGLRIAGKRGAASWSAIGDVLARLAGAAFEHDVAGALDLIVTRFYDGYATAAFDNGANRLRELTSLAELGARFATMDEFLTSAALAGEITGVDQLDDEARDEKLVLSSVHQAKGLEFHAVFVIWLADERFPSAQSLSEADVEEERRLFYVAVTRAERELYLSTPITTVERGVGLVTLRDSVFVRELERVAPPAFERISLVRRSAANPR